MSTLRQRLKRPETYLILFAVMAVLLVLDSIRSPERQLSARVYVAVVHGYQHYGRAVSSRFVSCRYEPTCSEYSIEAVQKHGIRRGLSLTVRRIYACRASVQPGTADPVP